MVQYLICSHCNFELENSENESNEWYRTKIDNEYLNHFLEKHLNNFLKGEYPAKLMFLYLFSEMEKNEMLKKNERRI